MNSVVFFVCTKNVEFLEKKNLEKSVTLLKIHSEPQIPTSEKKMVSVGLNLQFFSHHVLVVPPDETWVGIYTLKDCYPVQETYTKNSSVTTSTRFFNLQLGISDPDVFTPPSTCQSAKPNRMTEFHCWGLPAPTSILAPIWNQPICTHTRSHTQLTLKAKLCLVAFFLLPADD